MIEIGKGAKQTLILRLKPSSPDILSSDDTILFALKDIDDTVIMTESSTIAELETDSGGRYVFYVDITSETTLAMDYKAPYFYDFTLIDSLGQKQPLTNRHELKIIKTVGASIVDDDEEETEPTETIEETTPETPAQTEG
jgi:hypothetical protein